MERLLLSSASILSGTGHTVYVGDYPSSAYGSSATLGNLYKSTRLHPCVPLLAGESPLEAEPDKRKRPHNHT